MKLNKLQSHVDNVVIQFVSIHTNYKGSWLSCQLAAVRFSPTFRKYFQNRERQIWINFPSTKTVIDLNIFLTLLSHFNAFYGCAALNHLNHEVKFRFFKRLLLECYCWTHMPLRIRWLSVKPFRDLFKILKVEQGRSKQIPVNQITFFTLVLSGLRMLGTVDLFPASCTQASTAKRDWWSVLTMRLKILALKSKSSSISFHANHD